MLRTTKRYIVTTEAKNALEFRVSTAGIDLSDYEKNPLLLFMHQRATGKKDTVLPLGNGVDLKVENGEITCYLELDDTDPFAVAIYNKLENGTLRMLSAGLKPKADAWAELDGEIWLVSSLLKEISVADIGSNSEALAVVLYDQDDNLITLSDQGVNAFLPLKTQIHDMKLINLSAAAVFNILKLADTATEAEATTAIQNLVTLADSQKGIITSLTTEKETAEKNVTALQTKLDAEVKLALDTKIEALVQAAVNDRKITAEEKPEYIALAQGNFASVEKIIGLKAASPTLATALAGANGDNLSELGKLVALSYDELFSNGGLTKLKTLSVDAYKAKHKEKFGSDPVN